MTRAMPQQEKTKAIMAPPRYVDALSNCFFYHTMDLPGLGEVKGHWDLRGRFDDYVGHTEVSGKRVLDVGTATGFLSFEAEARGAAAVVSFDMAEPRQLTLLPFKDKLYYRDREAWAMREFGPELEQWKNAYWLCHRLLNSRAEVFYGDIYKFPPELGSFDVTLIGSVLEHLNDPITALASIARVTTETIVVVTPLLESEERIAHFQGLADHPENDFTWWIYSLGTYREILKMLGFRIARVICSDYRYHHLDQMLPRHTIVAVRD
jgi:SAM-dependent methyltransferase